MTTSDAVDAWGEQLRALRRPLPSGLVERAQQPRRGSSVQSDRAMVAQPEQGNEAFAGTDLLDGATPVDYLDFAPISGPAAAVGARLTLTGENWSATCFCNIQPVSGTWQVTFVLTPHPATVVRWAPGSVGGLRYTFPKVTITDSKLVEIVMNAQGPALPASIFSGPGVQEVPAPRMVDAKGRLIREARVPWISGDAQGDTQSQDLDYILQTRRYRLFVYGLNGTSLERDLVVR